jgi:hypothetical protein
MSRLFCIAFMFAAACGPTTRSGDSVPSGPCDPGDTVSCYNGQDGTKGVGPCQEGKSTCDPSGAWGPCTGEVVPAGESCSDGVDNNCNGTVDEDEDRDGDGITTCGGDCCDSTECSAPALVNAGAFDAPGNMVDDDCDGMIDNTQLLCDQGIASNSGNAMDYARAMELCQTTTMADKKWGVIEATLTLANGMGSPATRSYAVRPKFGTNVMPRGGASMTSRPTVTSCRMRRGVLVPMAATRWTPSC